MRAADAVVLDLQTVMDEAHDKGAFGLKVDYSTSPFPPLAPHDEARVRALLASARCPA